MVLFAFPYLTTPHIRELEKGPLPTAMIYHLLKKLHSHYHLNMTFSGAVFQVVYHVVSERGFEELLTCHTLSWLSGVPLCNRWWQTWVD